MPTLPECCLAVKKALAFLLKEAAGLKVGVEIVEEVDGPVAGTLRSVLLELNDASGAGGELALARRWSGSLQWICDSPYRELHKRKNWLLNGAAFSPPEAPDEGGTIRYEATRASGSGGQHANKTDSAIRATHLESGLSVKVQTERSQHANKRLAGQLLASKLAAIPGGKAGKQRADRRLHHHQAERAMPAGCLSGRDLSSGARDPHYAVCA